MEYTLNHFPTKFMTSYFNSEELRGLLRARVEITKLFLDDTLIQFQNQVVEWH